VNYGVNDSSSASSPLHDESPYVGDNNIDVCELHGYAIAAVDKDNATAGHAIGINRIVLPGDQDWNAAKINADGKAKDYGEKCGGGGTTCGVDIVLGNVVEKVLHHIANTITVCAKLFSGNTAQHGCHKNNNQEMFILVDGEHMWNVNYNGSNSVSIYNCVATDGINGRTYYSGSLAILTEGINQYIGEYASRNIKTAGSDSSRYRISDTGMCMQGVRFQLSSSDAIYDTINASTEEQINHSNTTIEGIDYSQAVSSCKTGIREHDWGEIQFHIDITEEDTSKIHAREVGTKSHATIINGDQLTFGVNRGEVIKKICGNDKYSKSIVTVDKVRDHRNPDYNKSNGWGVRELVILDRILVSRILYYSVRIR